MAVLTTQELEYVVRSYHEYKHVWTPVMDEMLSIEIERGNLHDEYAVVLILDGLLLVESRALLIIVLCGICVILQVQPWALSWTAYGMLRCCGCPCCDDPRYRWAQWTRLKLVGDRCHGTTHVKVTLSLFRTRPPPINLSGQWRLLWRGKFFSGLGGILTGEAP